MAKDKMVRCPILEGKKALIVSVANDMSMAASTSWLKLTTRRVPAAVVESAFNLILSQH